MGSRLGSSSSDVRGSINYFRWNCIMSLWFDLKRTWHKTWTDRRDLISRTTSISGRGEKREFTFLEFLFASHIEEVLSVLGDVVEPGFRLAPETAQAKLEVVTTPVFESLSVDDVVEQLFFLFSEQGFQTELFGI